ncbi:hypothetical protein BDEG_26745 [Batrachochytrium dendrobatidis JEL423]|uniref:Peptidase A1 domain-containing protein n=1 Tax=Batrachochytrium dendrobatidis (strain JEL423) TaxID=403673 RepID=A0A177WVD8_BATDL|nr:hypothetical protein BDEG_26745 [Batrachochytrium dendrobatidis JEL423]
MSDIIVPLPSSSNDVSLAPQHTPSGEPVTIKYKGDDYNGVSSDAVVTIPGTRITDINLPVVAVEKQSPDLVGISSKFDGVFGFAYTLLSKHHPPATAMDVLYNHGVIPNNEIGLQLCPYDILQESFINIGNTDVTEKCGTDGTSVAWVNSPTNDHHTVNIKSILVNGKRVELPDEFQKKVEHERTLYSVVETCCTYMHFPRVVVETLIDAIVGSGAITIKNNMLRREFNQEDVDDIFWKHRLMIRSNLDINWGRMPSLSITMFAQTPVTVENRNSVVTIKLGPKNYIQRVNSKEFVFAVQAGSNEKAVLGMSFMTRLGLTFDRQNKRIGFGPGCGCETMNDGYPTISNGYQVLWPLPRLTEQPTTSGSDGTFIRRRKPTTTTDQAVVPENTHHTVKSRKQTLNKLD